MRTARVGKQDVGQPLSERAQKLAMRRNRRGEPGYVKMPVALFPYPRLTTDEKIMWMLLKDRQGDKDDTRYGQKTLGEFLRWSRHKAGRVIRSLYRKQWITLKALPLSGHYSISARPGVYMLKMWTESLEQEQMERLKASGISSDVVKKLA